MDVTKTIIPAAGLGTRFFPFTKSLPKEMVPLLEKPALQWIIEECLASDIKQFSIVTSRSKQAIENHFDIDPGLEITLKEKNKQYLLSGIEKILRSAQFSYIRQPEPLGLGHAVLTARHTVGKEYFSVLLPDEIFISQQPAIGQLIKIARQEKASIVAVREVPMDQVSSYGVVALKKQITPKLFQVSHLVEKPKQQDAPSNLAMVGRYILSHKVFDSLAELNPYAENELQLPDGISHMLKKGEKVFAYKISGTRYDIGKPLGWIEAVIGTALQDPRYSAQVRNFIKTLDSLDSPLHNMKSPSKKTRKRAF